MKKKNKYTIDDLVVINPDEHVLNNPLMYWGTDSPKSIDYINGVKKQLEILNCKDIKILKVDNWHFIGSTFDWIKSGLINDRSINDLFGSLSVFPEAGGTSIRSEYIVKLYADHMVLWRNNTLNEIKGNIDNGITEFLKENYTGYVTLAFKVDKES